ncbi:MAG: hypothetical protein WCI54_01405 [Bacteroidia bacterium]|jgi:hypothetical protein
MKTKYLMTASAVFLGFSGILFTFIPEEVLYAFGLEATKPLQLLVQITGALYFGFGMLNWMTKSGLIGGIYNRPVAVANISHFSIAGLALLKALVSNPDLPLMVWIAGIIYGIFAISFGLILFRHPISVPKSE